MKRKVLGWKAPEVRPTAHLRLEKLLRRRAREETLWRKSCQAWDRFGSRDFSTDFEERGTPSGCRDDEIS
jgi:hypothetical protein